MKPSWAAPHLLHQALPMQPGTPLPTTKVHHEQTEERMRLCCSWRAHSPAALLYVVAFAMF